MKKKLYDKPTMELVGANEENEILASSIRYEATTGLEAMDNDADLGDAAKAEGSSLWSMGADEDL